MSRYGNFRYGFDEPALIAGTAQMMTLGAELPPGEPMYTPIPFLPPPVISSSTSTTTDTQVWTKAPGRLDLTWYQGDDVMIPLYFDNPEDTDMSDQDGFQWHAEVRLYHTYRSTLVNTFTIDSEAIPAIPPAPAQTKVTLFLPRTENVYVGRYRWDLYSISPITEDMTEYPRPPDVPLPEVWPPTTTLRTWLYGNANIAPRVTETDALPPPVDGGGEVGVYGAGFFVGPNGRVP